MDSIHKIPIRASIQRLVQLSGRNWLWLLLAVIVVLFETATTIAFNWTVARFMDAVTARSFQQFWFYLWFTFALSIIGIPFGYLHSYSIGRFSERTLSRLRQIIAERVTLLPMRYLEERHTGDLLAIVNADLSKLKILTGNSLLEFFRQSVMAVAALVTLFLISWPLALLSTMLIPFMLVVMSRMNQPIARRSERMQQHIGETVSIAEDGLGGLMVTRAFNLTAIMDERYQRANSRALKQGLQLARMQSLSQSGGSIFGMLPFLITFGFGGYLTISGRLSFGSLFMFVNLLNYVANPLGALPPLIASIGESAGAAQRMFQLIDEETERSSGEVFASDGPSEIIASLRQLWFAYEKEEIIRGVSFDVKRGQTIAIVGSSGGGKSTLLKLILGFYPLQEGHLILYEHDLTTWKLEALRKQLAYVAQDTFLFSVTIAENIAGGKPGCSQAEIEQAARLANIHDFILSLPEGYQTMVGERGARLSGGQRQRISLARAILKDAPILLLDEPTSALDSESEAQVQEALDRFMADRTTIVVAHRLSTIRNADRVFVVERGEIVEDGTHESLFSQGGRYRELYLRQYAEPGLTA